uniref:Deltamethrin resistance protein prag01 domain-containing protein n=1 Tax=Argas monolakensis TaxID=34602 RepID=Q09JM1_ARGMO|nr:hypothetical protein [Argas monolakensis]
MIARLATRRVLQAVLKRPNVRTTAHYEPADFKPVTLDDMPKFLGPWEDCHSKAQSRNNILLAAAAVFFVGSCVAMYGMDVIDLGNAPPMKN